MLIRPGSHRSREDSGILLLDFGVLLPPTVGGLMLKLKLQSFGHLMQTDSFEDSDAGKD